MESIIMVIGWLWTLLVAGLLVSFVGYFFFVGVVSKVEEVFKRFWRKDV